MVSFATFGNELYSGERSYNIVGRRRLWFTIAIAGVILSILVLSLKGMNLGIEFRGGTQFTISGSAETSSDPAVRVLRSAGVTDVRTAVVGENSLRVQTEALEATTVETLRTDLADAYGVSPSDITSTLIGPAWGADVTTKALQGLIIFLVLVSIVMSVYFRSWRMSAAAIVALLHDLVITVGLYALVGFEVTPASMIGFLTILGYSLYDTVVVFDKVRENTAGLREQHTFTYEEGANLAVNQTLVRSINTSIVALLPVASILFVGAFLLGAGTLKDISLALFIGMAVSTISSIFIATPLEVELRNREATVREHTADVLERRAAAEAAAAAREGAVEGATPEPKRSAASYAGRGIVVTGEHKGQTAQPKRRSRSKR